jgi:hypothetical protein
MEEDTDLQLDLSQRVPQSVVYKKRFSLGELAKIGSSCAVESDECATFFVNRAIDTEYFKRKDLPDHVVSH